MMYGNPYYPPTGGFYPAQPQGGAMPRHNELMQKKSRPEIPDGFFVFRGINPR